MLITGNVRTRLVRRARVDVSVKIFEETRRHIEEMNMTVSWSTPEICEVCVGMEVTSYASAEI